MTAAWRETATGVTIAVRAQPKSRRPGIAAEAGRLRIAVTEAPEDGRANRAVCEALAAAAGVPNSAVSVRLGVSRRDKTVNIAGDPADIVARLARIP